MSERYNNRYRVASARLPGWNYRAGWYFITVCTQQRKPWLSTVTGATVQLSSIGHIVAAELQRTPTIRPYVTLDAWVIMPDHVHAIIGIHPVPPGTADAAGAAGAAVETPRRGVSTPDGTPTGTVPPTASTLHAGTLGAIVGQWKSIATKQIRAGLCAEFAWQPRYYDVIIRDAAMLAQVRDYIADNPRHWSQHRP